MKKLTLTLTLALMLMACSQQNRFASPPVEGNELNLLMSEILPTAQGFSSNNEQLFFNSSNATIYYAEGKALANGVSSTDFDPGQSDAEQVNFDQPGIMGYPENVFAFTNFDFIQPGLIWQDMLTTRVFFAADFVAGQFSLATDVELSSEGSEVFNTAYLTDVYQQLGDAVVTADDKTGVKTFEVSLQSATGEIIDLRSFDVKSGDELKPVIQLEVWGEQGGEYVYFGKFSALVGYQ